LERVFRFAKKGLAIYSPRSILTPVFEPKALKPLDDR
jgi:hypothetical protein